MSTLGARAMESFFKRSEAMADPDYEATRGLGMTLVSREQAQTHRVWIDNQRLLMDLVADEQQKPVDERNQIAIDSWNLQIQSYGLMAKAEAEKLGKSS